MLSEHYSTFLVMLLGYAAGCFRPAFGTSSCRFWFSCFVAGLWGLSKNRSNQVLLCSVLPLGLGAGPGGRPMDKANTHRLWVSLSFISFHLVPWAHEISTPSHSPFLLCMWGLSFSCLALPVRRGSSISVRSLKIPTTGPTSRGTIQHVPKSNLYTTILLFIIIY
jgi:hypothetical protein